MPTVTKAKVKTSCFHCGDPVNHSVYVSDEHAFCCLGCQGVYTLLRDNKLQGYYQYQEHPGIRKDTEHNNVDYLDEPRIADKLLDFRDDRLSKITFYIPAIHCSSCIWLLEHLYKLNTNIIQSRTDFLKKQVSITFRHQVFSLKELVTLLQGIGYGPIISLQDVIKENRQADHGKLLRKIAVAGFCFGNSMMISFPEYFGMASFEQQYSALFGYINLSLSLPALLYSGNDYFVSAFQSLKGKTVNLSVPLALGMFILFLRSAVEILSGSGAGFSDTLCGLIFFLLIGKWVQERTLFHLSFERDYRSYFPIAVTCLTNGKEKAVPIGELEVGDRILIRNGEIVPADSILLSGDAAIDFSFVTGESAPVRKVLGELIYAGGKQTAKAIELEIIKPVSQSYLTQLWNDQVEQNKTRDFTTFSETVSRYFTPCLIAISLLAAGFWFIQHDHEKAWGAFTAILIIACPCALALSSPFTLSAALSLLDRGGFYAKNTRTIEKLAAINTLVFDKTGTITNPIMTRLSFEGQLSQEEKNTLSAVCYHSAHPLSRAIVREIGAVETDVCTNYQEISGKGIQAFIGSREIQVGNAAFLGLDNSEDLITCVFVKIDHQLKGVFKLKQAWREALASTLSTLNEAYDLHLISGDRQQDLEDLSSIFGEKENVHFDQKPKDKLHYIRSLQEKGRQVCMLGDGLNDANALRQADLGIAVSDDINNFSPGCDAILDGRAFDRLPTILHFSKAAVRVIHQSFVLSILYNLVGLFFAAQGTMSPLFAAILMPLSTVTIISFTSLATHYHGRKLIKNPLP